MIREKAFVGDVLDGNTLELRKAKHLYHTRYEAILARVYAPPLTRKEGREAKAALRELINMRPITLEVVGTGTSNMPLVEVWIDEINVNEETNVNDWMINKGYGDEKYWPPEPDWPYIKER